MPKPSKRGKEVEKKIPDEYCDWDGIQVKNVGELKKALAKLPDDLDVAYGGSSMKLAVHNVGDDSPTEPFIVFEEIDY